MAIKVFISSVQSEFSVERKRLFDYIREDALLGRFFVPYIFEETPAMGVSACHAYLSEVRSCDIYLGLFGSRYGFEDEEGISPTEREYDLATQCNKLRLIYITRLSEGRKRHAKQAALVEKAERSVVRRSFASYEELQESVYSSLVRFLIEKDFVRERSFDDSVCLGASLQDIDLEKLDYFVALARGERGFPIPFSAGAERILTHLNLMTQSGALTNAAVLLFGKRPQEFFASAMIKCAHFYGDSICKPIPSHHIYKGTVFEMVDAAVDFVMSRLDNYVGTRAHSNAVPVVAEIPRDAVTEAIVNAVVHRDYTSGASVQVMVFSDRVEVWNPGQLPYGLSPDRLASPHYSVPHNQRIAGAAYLAGYIEQMGTGTSDIVEKCLDWGLRSPIFRQEECFKVILWRSDYDEPVLEAREDEDMLYSEWARAQRQIKLAANKVENGGANKVKNKQRRGSVFEKQNAVVAFCSVPRSSLEIMQHIGVTRQTRTVNLYIGDLIKEGRLRALFPGKPNSPRQRYIAAEGQGV